MSVAAGVLLFLLGVVLSLFYFGGLWWTVRRIPSASHPGWLYGVSTILRLGVVFTVLVLLITDDWRGFFLALAGFLIARLWFVRSIAGGSSEPDEGASAPLAREGSRRRTVETNREES